MRDAIDVFFSSPGAVRPIRFPARSYGVEVLSQRPLLKLVVFGLAILAAALNLAVPWTQRSFVNELNNGQAAFAWVLWAFVATLVAQLLIFVYRLLSVRDGLLLQKSLSSALYRKALRLSHTERAGRTVGEIITYYAQDVSTAASVVEDFFPQILTSVLPLLLAPLALGALLEVPLGGVLGTLGVSLGITVWLGMRQSRFFSLNKRNSQNRLAVVNEWLQNIRILRVLGWVGSFEDEITRLRKRESYDRLRMVTNSSTMNSLTQSLPFLLNLITVAALVSARGHDLSPGDVFAALWIFGVFLARPLRTLPFLLVTWNDVATSARRLGIFLALPEEEHELGIVPQEKVEKNSSSESAIGLAVQGLNLFMGERKVLDNISFTIAPGEFVAVVGEVGSGKSLLLQSLVRHVPSTFGEYRLGKFDVLTISLEELRCHFSLAPQDSFVMSSSLRDNVTLTYGTPLDHDAEVGGALRLAEFDIYREQVPDGLGTQIGERGVNLSGGQRQRVNLARCVHFGRPVLLLDDSLSAVDVATESRLRTSLLEGAWRGRTRLLVTHRLSILPYVDRIFVMEGGRLVEQGSPAELLDHSPRLARLAARGGV